MAFLLAALVLSKLDEAHVMFICAHTPLLSACLKMIFLERRTGTGCACVQAGPVRLVAQTRLACVMAWLARCCEVFQWFNILLSLSGSRSSTSDACKFHPQPRASDLKPMKSQTESGFRIECASRKSSTIRNTMITYRFSLRA